MPILLDLARQRADELRDQAGGACPAGPAAGNAAAADTRRGDAGNGGRTRTASATPAAGRQPLAGGQERLRRRKR
jgi:hypothetical protein